MGGKLRLLCAPASVLAAGALLLGHPAAATAFSKAIWGPVTRHGVNQFPLYRQLGVSVYEADLPWNQVALRRPANPVNPGDPAYRWPAQLQQAIRQARRFHMRVLLQIIGAPTWANAGPLEVGAHPPGRLRGLRHRGGPRVPQRPPRSKAARPKASLKYAPCPVIVVPEHHQSRD